MYRPEDRFHPETIDDQIEFLSQSIRHKQPVTPDERLVYDLYQVYSEDTQTLENVWTRLTAYTEHSTPEAMERKRQQNAYTDRRRTMHLIERNRAEKNEHAAKRSFTRYLTIAVAVLLAVLLIGSTVLVLNAVRHQGSGLAGPGHTNAGNTLSNASSNRAGSAVPTPLPATPAGLYGCTTNGVHRADALNGRTIWNYALPPDPAASGRPGSFSSLSCQKLLFAKSVAYAAVSGGSPARAFVLALDAESGKLNWKYDLKGASEISDMAIEGELLYVGTHPANSSAIRNVIALNLDGTERARYQVPAGRMALAGNTLYVTASDGPHAFSLPDGKQLWHTPFTNLGANPTYIVDGVLYTSYSKGNKTGGPRSGAVVAFDAKNGQQLWLSPPTADYIFDLTVANGVVYFGSQDQWLYAYDAKKGKQLWKHNVGGIIDHAPVVDEHGTLYASAYTGSTGTFGGVVAVKAASGSEIWRATISGGSMIAPAVANGVVFAANIRVYAFNTSNGTLLWSTSPSQKNPPLIPSTPVSLTAF
ncbi:MAG: PQQ-binding-like beta-propeller repeat protein [Ktedonobacteraceae bacterium]|nr:PQQ-binding-like beta-propeller repeat protein [Ktedonobacteraceae bacterium]